MLRRRRRPARRRVWLDDLTLVIGPCALTNATERELEQAWEQRRDVLLARPWSTGRRPWGWWEFDAREQQPPLEDQPARLLELDVLTDNERAALNTNQRSATK